MGERTTITTKDGIFGAYVARPVKSTAPAIVVIQEIFGVNQVMRDVTDGLAAQGYLAICPNLYSREAPGASPDDAAAAAVESMTLKDGRQVRVYATTADATTAVADAFVAAYKEARPWVAESAASDPRRPSRSGARRRKRRWCPRRAPSRSPSPPVRRCGSERSALRERRAASNILRHSSSRQRSGSRAPPPASFCCGVR